MACVGWAAAIDQAVVQQRIEEMRTPQEPLGLRGVCGGSLHGRYVVPAEARRLRPDDRRQLHAPMRHVRAARGRRRLQQHRTQRHAPRVPREGVCVCE
jgi:hypothetical protein